MSKFDILKWNSILRNWTEIEIFITSLWNCCLSFTSSESWVSLKLKPELLIFNCIQVYDPTIIEQNGYKPVWDKLRKIIIIVIIIIIMNEPKDWKWYMKWKWNIKMIIRNIKHHDKEIYLPDSTSKHWSRSSFSCYAPEWSIPMNSRQRRGEILCHTAARLKFPADCSVQAAWPSIMSHSR